MITLTIPPDKIDAVRKAAMNNGINLTKDNGVVEYKGFKIGYVFDGHELNLNVLHKPFLYKWVTDDFLGKQLMKELENL